MKFLSQVVWSEGMYLSPVHFQAQSRFFEDNLDFLRSTPRNGLTAAAHAAGSPPALYVNDEGRVGPMDTPFPLRPTARLAPPSTLRRPSDFIQFSSPAPFWKMEGLVGSTPFKPYDMSPLKTPFPMLKPKIENAEEEEEKKYIRSDADDESKVVSTGDVASIKSPNSTQGAKSAIDDDQPLRLDENEPRGLVANNLRRNCLGVAALEERACTWLQIEEGSTDRLRVLDLVNAGWDLTRYRAIEAFGEEAVCVVREEGEIEEAILLRVWKLEAMIEGSAAWNLCVATVAAEVDGEETD